MEHMWSHSKNLCNVHPWLFQEEKWGFWSKWTIVHHDTFASYIINEQEVEKAIGEENQVVKISLCIRCIHTDYSKLFDTPPSELHSVSILATCGKKFSVFNFFVHSTFKLSLRYEDFWHKILLHENFWTQISFKLRYLQLKVQFYLTNWHWCVATLCVYL